MSGSALATSMPRDFGLDDLRELMLRVNSTTEQLQGTHVALHEQVASLKTELGDANAQLKRSKALAALGEMAAGIAHEVRNPLGSIRLYTQMLQEDVVAQPEQAELCEKIMRSVVMLDAVVRDVLLFARDMRVSRAEITTGELIDQSLLGCVSFMESGDVSVERVGDEKLVIEADMVLATLALGNVIRNGVEAMMEGAGVGRLTIRSSIGTMRCPDGVRASRVVIAVEDTGPGIPEEVVERMFNPFFTTRASGTGLGLAIVNRIAEAHGGHVMVKNTGHGACVGLCLPSVEEHIDSSIHLPRKDTVCR